MCLRAAQAVETGEKAYSKEVTASQDSDNGVVRSTSHKGWQTNDHVQRWRSNMSINEKAVRTAVIFTVLMTGVVGLNLTLRASAADRGDIKKMQETLRDKGYAPGI
jgi:hypothetical protein